jgi:hypothetical protein
MLSLAVVLALCAAVPGAVGGVQGTVPYPGSIASIGDSLTRPNCTRGSACGAIPADSWSTGSNPAVVSH